MANTFMVQIQGNPELCKIEAEKIVEEGMQNTTEGRLLFKNAKDELVGKFKTSAVVGWWKLFPE
jgi:hypothetical protein